MKGGSNSSNLIMDENCAKRQTFSKTSSYPGFKVSERNFNSILLN